MTRSKTFGFFAVVIVGCKMTSSSPPDATADTAIDVMTPDVGTPVVCKDAAASPTLSFSLDAWPAFAAITAPDLTAASNVKSVATPGGGPAGVLVSKDGANVYVALTSGSLGVFKRQGVSLTFDHAITMPANEAPFGLAQTMDGSTIVANMSDAVAIVVNGALVTSVPTHSVQKTGIDIALSKDGAFAFAALEYDRAVAVIDVKNQAYVGAIPITGNAITGVVVSPDGKRLYVTTEVADEFTTVSSTDQNVGTITTIDVATAETSPTTAMIARAFVGRAPVRSALSPDGSQLWVTLRGSNAVAVLDTANLATGACDPLIATIAVGASPVGIGFTSDGTRVAVANSNRFAQPTANQTVMMIGVSSMSVYGQITVGAFPRELDSDTSALFVSNYNSQSISGLDLTALPAP